MERLNRLLKLGGAQGETIRKAENSGNLNTSGTGVTGSKAGVSLLPVHGSLEETQARQTNPSMIRSNACDVVVVRIRLLLRVMQVLLALVENLYDDQGRSLGDLVAMNDLQVTYDMFSYGKELSNQGFDFESAPSVASQIKEK